MKKFSIIIPTYNRAKTIIRALKSLANQTYDKSLFEVIVVDDGSTDDTLQLIKEFGFKHGRSPEVIVHEFKENKGRLAARNKGMELASGEWICWLDSDDEYLSTYLTICEEAIRRNPEAKVFNFGAIFFNYKTLCSSFRNAFVSELRADGRGHVSFKSGGIGTGSFIFKKELLSSIGFLPEAATPYGVNDSFPALVTAKWPEFEQLYGRNADGQWLPFGNPWGDDYVMFYLLTRNNISVPINIHPYIQHVR